jgi:hypothetical protein
MNVLTELDYLTKGNALNEILNEVGREMEFLSNGFIERLDVDFTSQFFFNKIGDHNIYIGACPQNENDIRNLRLENINAVLNLQTDLEMIHKNIDWKASVSFYEKNEIKFVRCPIKDYNENDLKEKLFDAVQELKKLIINNHIVYVHCTGGMSSSAATVIAYFVFYDTFSLEESYEYVKSNRNTICPDMNTISEVVLKNKYDDFY